MEPLTILLASFLEDLTLLRFSSTCATNAVVLTGQRDNAVTRACLAQLELLRELDAIVQQEDDADTAYWWSHVASDWDLSD